MEAQGTKELMEAIEALAVVAKAGMKIAKDGKVDLSDLLALVDLGKEYGVIMAGVQDAEKIADEIKDLSLEEAQAVIMKLLAAVADVKAA